MYMQYTLMLQFTAFCICAKKKSKKFRSSFAPIKRLCELIFRKRVNHLHKLSKNSVVLKHICTTKMLFFITRGLYNIVLVHFSENKLNLIDSA